MKAVCAALLLLFAACGGSPPPPPENSEATTPPPVAPVEEPPTELERSDRQVVELALKVVGDMVAAAATASGSCEAMGQSLSSLAVANADLFGQLDAISADEQRSAILDEFREGMENAMTELFAHVSECGADPGVRQAMEAMGG